MNNESLLEMAIQTVALEILQNKKPSILDTKFQKQTDFINYKARRKALFCTRRAAKSYTAGLGLFNAALDNPGCNCLYVGLTRMSAKDIIWKDVLKIIDRKYNLGSVFNETEATVTLPNGSVIRITGVDSTDDDMQKLLGKKYKLVVVDEGQSYTVDLRTLFYGILGPTVVDEGGDMWLMGTAGNLTVGLFYDVTTRKEQGWEVFEWSAHDNPYIGEKWQAELDDIDKNRPLFKETSLYKQWYLNQWVIDEDARVYKYDEKRNTALCLPQDFTGWHYVLGLDLAHSPDSTAFVVGAYHEASPILFIVHAEKHLKLDITDTANKVKELDRKFKFEVKVVDGANKQAVAELNNRHELNLIPADKTGKVDFITLMNNDFIQGLIKLLPGTESLAEEYKRLIWVTDANGKVKEPKKENPVIHQDLCFVAGTLVETRHGPKTIETVTIDDEILTRYGYRSVARCGQTRISDIVEVEFSNGARLMCTPDHPVWTQDGFVPATSLTVTHRCITRGQWKHKYTTTSHGEGMRVGATLRQRWATLRGRSIGMCGQGIMGLFLRAGTFITKTETHLTTPFQISSVLPPNSITLNTQRKDRPGPDHQKILRILNAFGRSLRHGTPLLRATLGMLNMARSFLKKIAQRFQLFAPSVSNPMSETLWHRVKGLFAQEIALPKKDVCPAKTTSTKSAHGARSHIESTSTQNASSAVFPVMVKIRTLKDVVFNLQIDEHHEYFANGILVSNCDSALYLWRRCYQYIRPMLHNEKPFVDWNRQSSWETAHLENLAEQVRKEQKPNELSLEWNDDWDSQDQDLM